MPDVASLSDSQIYDLRRGLQGGTVNFGSVEADARVLGETFEEMWKRRVNITGDMRELSERVRQVERMLADLRHALLQEAAKGRYAQAIEYFTALPGDTPFTKHRLGSGQIVFNAD